MNMIKINSRKRLSGARAVWLLSTFVILLCCVHAVPAQAALRLNKTALSLTEGQSAALKLNGTNKKIIWRSSNKAVAVVTKKGKVTAKTPGKAVITASAGKKVRKCTVTVTTNYAKYYEYQIKYDKVTINKLLRISETELTIPDTIEGCPVTELSDGLFENCDGLEKITLPSGITRIGASMFAGCHQLREIVCSGSISSIGARAFYECNALEKLPDLSAVETIDAETFYNCDALSTLPVALNLKSIGDYAFYDCDKLLTFFGSDSLSAIGRCAFKGCDALLGTSGCKNVLTIGEECFADCRQLGTVSVGNKLTTLGNGCFSGCEKLGSVHLSSLLSAIPDRCFYNCYALSNVTVPISVTRIGNMAFYNCIKLSILTFPGTGITSIAADSFAGVPFSSLQVWYRATADASSYLETWLKAPAQSAIQLHAI